MYQEELKDTCFLCYSELLKILLLDHPKQARHDYALGALVELPDILMNQWSRKSL